MTSYSVYADGNTAIEANVQIASPDCGLSVVVQQANFAFTYTYKNADAQEGAYGDTRATSGPAIVTVSSPGCEIYTLKLSGELSGNTVSATGNTAGIQTPGGGVFPYFLGISNINFFTGPDGSGTKVLAINGNASYHGASREKASSTDNLIVNGGNADNKLASSFNDGMAPGVATVSEGHMTLKGSPDAINIGQGGMSCTGGIFKIVNDNYVPTQISIGVSNQWGPSVDGSVKDSSGSYHSAVFELTPVVSRFPYNMTTKLPDPTTAFDAKDTSQPSIIAAATAAVTFTMM